MHFFHRSHENHAQVIRQFPFCSYTQGLGRCEPGRGLFNFFYGRTNNIAHSARNSFLPLFYRRNAITRATANGFGRYLVDLFPRVDSRLLDTSKRESGHSFFFNSLKALEKKRLRQPKKRLRQRKKRLRQQLQRLLKVFISFYMHFNSFFLFSTFLKGFKRFLNVLLTVFGQNSRHKARTCIKPEDSSSILKTASF